MPRIGLFGGSFNPPHTGHLAMALHAKNALELDEVWFLVSPQNPFKPAGMYAPLAHRLNMVLLLTSDYPWMRPMDLEKDIGSNWTADTIHHMKKTYPQHDFVWLMGDDNFISFHKWDRMAYKIKGHIVPDWEYIMHEVPVAVLARHSNINEVLSCDIAQNDKAIQHQNVRDLMTEKSGWHILNNDLYPESSTSIRAALAGEITADGLTENIKSYIADNNLYRA